MVNFNDDGRLKVTEIANRTQEEETRRGKGKPTKKTKTTDEEGTSENTTVE